MLKFIPKYPFVIDDAQQPLRQGPGTLSAISRRCLNIENYSVSMLFSVLSLGFLAIYLPQVPFLTSNSDVLVYSLRASADQPIVRYAFLDERSLSSMGEAPLPNYHLAHTFLLWLFYRVVPSHIASTIYPSGILSSLCGALAVGLTFLIWLQVGFKKQVAFFAGIVVGFLPSIYYHSLIGEVYSLQLAATLGFVYWFQQKRVALAALFFLFSNLVSPVSALCFVMAFIKNQKKETLIRALLVGSIAFVCYVGVCWLSGVSFQSIIGVGGHGLGQKGPMWVTYRLIPILAFNIGLLSPFFFLGSHVLWKKHRNIFWGVIAIVLSQLISFYLQSASFVEESGCFQIPFLWITALPIALGLVSLRRPALYLLSGILALTFTTQILWVTPQTSKGKDLYRAGLILREVVPEDVKIMGDWNVGVGVTLARYGWDFEILSNNYLEHGWFNATTLQKTGERALIIIMDKQSKSPFDPRTLLYSERMMNQYDPRKHVTYGEITKLFENSAVSVFAWKTP